jgi:hypothetical protein
METGSGADSTVQISENHGIRPGCQHAQDASRHMTATLHLVTRILGLGSFGGYGDR